MQSLRLTELPFPGSAQLAGSVPVRKPPGRGSWPVSNVCLGVLVCWKSSWRRWRYRASSLRVCCTVVSGVSMARVHPEALTPLSHSHLCVLSALQGRCCAACCWKVLLRHHSRLACVLCPAFQAQLGSWDCLLSPLLGIQCFCPVLFQWAEEGLWAEPGFLTSVLVSF